MRERALPSELPTIKFENDFMEMTQKVLATSKAFDASLPSISYYARLHNQDWWSATSGVAKSPITGTYPKAPKDSTSWYAQENADEGCTSLMRKRQNRVVLLIDDSPTVHFSSSLNRDFVKENISFLQMYAIDFALREAQAADAVLRIEKQYNLFYKARCDFKKVTYATGSATSRAAAAAEDDVYFVPTGKYKEMHFSLRSATLRVSAVDSVGTLSLIHI